jgi:vacuolar-type H+-ATPase subunit E/Vma4
MSDVKEQVMEALKNLPDDASYEDILDVIYIQQKITKALEHSKQGKVISHEQMLKKIKDLRTQR